MNLPRMTLMIGMMLVIAACSRGDRDVVLTKLKKPNDGPDEFAISPGKPLQPPLNYAELPTPTPGEGNLADQDPRSDAIAVLGGNTRTASTGGIAAADAGLVRHSSRFGTEANIRQTLRTEDEDTRRRYGNVNLLRIGPRDDYANAYKDQWLDAVTEESRLRRSGVSTPTAPPVTE